MSQTKKQIWIDGYEANVPARVGSGQVAFNLLRSLEELDQQNAYTILLPSPPLADLPKEREGWKYRILKPRRLWTRIALPMALRLARHKPDVFFSPTHYIPQWSPVKTVMMIFDLAYLRFTEMFTPRDLWQLKLWTGYSLRHAAAIVTISQSAKKDILQNYPIPSDRITIAYPGYDKELFLPVKDQSKVKAVLAKYRIEGEYVIYIGTIQPRKNISRLIEAVAKIEGLKLVVVGKTSGPGRQGWKYQQILDLPAELGIEDRVIFTGFAPSEDLPALLSGSIGYVLPSLWEGFGIPVVEAMATGVPVIVSEVSSLPEVVGEAGLMVNPRSVDQLEQAIRTLMTEPKLRAKLSVAGVVQAQKFSWEKMAKQVLKVLEEVA